MGNYCYSPLEYLVSEYGQENVGKFIVATKEQQAIDQQLPKIKENIRIQHQDLCRKSLSHVNQISDETQRSYVNKVSDIRQSRVPQIQKFQANTRSRIEDHLAVDQLHNQLQAIKGNASGKAKVYEKAILTQAQQVAIHQKSLIDANKPRIGAFQNMPSFLQEKVLQQGEKKYAQQIKINQEVRLEQLKRQMQFEELKRRNPAVTQTNSVVQVKKVKQQYQQHLKRTTAAIDKEGGGCGCLG